MENITTKTKALSPWRLIWEQLKKNRVALSGGVTLIILYAGALFAGFIAPNDPQKLHNELIYHPPTKIHYIDTNGSFHFRPFVYNYTLIDKDRRIYKEDTTKMYPVYFFVRGFDYSLFYFLKTNIHFAGVKDGGYLFPLGSDSLGRDILSRLLYGAQISLSVGIIGISISLFFGMLIGGISGYYGGSIDNLIMRFSELILSIPGLYLILALRAAFPITKYNLTSAQIYLIIVVILSFIRWAGTSRIIRGMVLSIKSQEFVLAAKALGASDLRIIVRHILPNTFSYMVVAATLAIPYYILGEVALSFLGVGIQEPQASWGNMLQDAQNIQVIAGHFYWILSPGAAIFLTVLAFNFLGDGLRDALDPRVHIKK